MDGRRTGESEQAHIARINDEIERLREALQHILTHCKSDAPPNAQALILFANNALGNE